MAKKTQTETPPASFNEAHPEALRNFLIEETKHKKTAKGLSDAQKTKKDEMVDSTGINKKALGWLGQLHRLKSENRQDVIRSLEKGISDMEPVWSQSDTKDMLG